MHKYTRTFETAELIVSFSHK